MATPAITGFRRLSSYGYSNLPHNREYIRLLIVEPGEKEDYIHCHLNPVPLADVQGTYECISYVWGSGTATRRIIVDGEDFVVTLNLYHALQHFRLPDKERTLWADAICIAQMNPVEKGTQVQLMGHIYGNCARTLVWLGPDSDGTALETTEFLKATSKSGRELCDRYGNVHSIPSLSKEENPIDQDPRKWEMFEAFVNLPWFTRTWVMQEVGIAPGALMHLGDTQILLSDVINVNEMQRHVPHIFNVLKFSWSLHDTFGGVFMTYANTNTWRDQVIKAFIDENHQLVPEQSVLDALLQSSRKDVTDKRDYIYALLAHPLLRMEGDTIVHADYKRPADDVYLEVTTKVLQHVDATLTLCVVGCMSARGDRALDSDQPSWVVRWDLGHGCNNIGRMEQWYYSGTRDGVPRLDIDASAKTLTLDGVIFDRVVWTSDQMWESQVQIDDLTKASKPFIAMEKIWDALPEEPCRYTGKHGSRDAYTMSLVCGASGHRFEAETDVLRHRHLANAYLDYVKSFFNNGDGGMGKGNESLRKDARDFENDFALFAKARRFIVTEKGFYGLGPQMVQHGDVVAVIPGLRVPFVLRAHDRGYKWVGAAYVHGVMRGEVLDESDPLSLNAGAPREIVIV